MKLTQLDISSRNWTYDSLMDVFVGGLFPRWSEVHQSQYIESILCKLPITYFHVVKEDGHHPYLFDGVERFLALRAFHECGMRLQGLSFLEEFNGRTLDELPDHFPRLFRECVFPVYYVDLSGMGAEDVAFVLDVYKRRY